MLPMSIRACNCKPCLDLTKASSRAHDRRYDLPRDWARTAIGIQLFFSTAPPARAAPPKAVKPPRQGSPVFPWMARAGKTSTALFFYGSHHGSTATASFIPCRISQRALCSPTCPLPRRSFTKEPVLALLAVSGGGRFSGPLLDVFHLRRWRRAGPWAHQWRTWTMDSAGRALAWLEQVAGHWRSTTRLPGHVRTWPLGLQESSETNRGHGKHR